MTAVDNRVIQLGDDDRAARLFIVRQSNVGAHADLRTLLERTLALYSNVPGCDEIEALGIEPVINPRPSDQYWELPDGGAAVLYEVQGTWVLLILGSAASKNAASTVIDKRMENAVVNRMCDVVATLRPIEIFIGPFDRVNRSNAFATQTWEAFRNAGVEVMYMEDPPGEIWFDSEQGEDEFYGLSRGSAANYKVVVRRTTSGKVSMARRNLWYFGDWQTPVGLTKDASGRLVVDERDRLAVKIMVEGFAKDSSGAEIARQLVAANALRRRRPPRQSANTAPNFVTAQNERSRTERAVSMFRERMPDLAMGKHVVRVKEPAATNFTHRGVRRERDATTGEIHHVLVWEVPDIFDHIDEDDLDAALLIVSRRRARAGERPSQWIHECEQRQLVLADMADVSDDQQDARNTARRKQQANEMSRPIGSGNELPRAARVREIVALAQGEAPRTNRNSSVPNTIRLFSGYPTWPQPDGHEYKLAGHRGGTYALLKRPQDEALSVAASLHRAWGIASNSPEVERFAVARFRFDQFHACLADAAAKHINDGVTVLTGQRAAAGGIVMASQHLETERVLRRQRLSRDLTTAESDVRAAKARLRAVTEYGAEQQDTTTPEVDEWSSVNGDLMREALQDEVQARARVKRIKEALERLADEAVLGQHQEMPELDDLTVALQTLVALRTKVMARTEQAHAIQSLIPRLNCVSVSAFEAKFEMDLLLPIPDGSLPVGPIRFSVPTAGTRPIGYESWSHAECEELTFRRLTMEDTKETRHGSTLANGWLIPKTYVAQRGADYLIKRGVRQKQARYVLQTTLLLPRIVVFHLVHDMAIDHEALGTSDEYIDLIRRTYLADQTVPVRVPGLATRDELQHLINRMKTMKHWRPSEIADYLNFPAERDPKRRDIRAAQRLTIRRENLPSVVARIGVRGLSREGKRMKNLTAYVPHQCPHCAEDGAPHPVDIVAWNAEVPGGLLCSRCLRTPNRDSIVYPAAYRGLLQTEWERPEKQIGPGADSRN